jgi:PAS domain S-box-containing protein
VASWRGPGGPFPCRVFDGSIELVDQQGERSKELFGAGEMTEEFLRVTEDGTRVAINEAHARAMGLRAGELLGLPLSEPASADRAGEIQALGRALADYRNTRKETRASFTRGGVETPQRFQAVITGEITDSDQTDQPTTALVVIRGVPDEPAVRDRLHRTYSLLEGIANGTDDMIAAEDMEFRYLYFNEAYRREFRKLWKQDLRVGMSMVEAMAPWPEQQQKARELWARALAGESFQITAEFGPSEAERRIYELRFNPIHAADGTKVGAAHIFRDITESREARDALAAAHRAAAAERDRLRAVLEILPVSVFIANAQGQIVMTNRAVEAIWGEARHTDSPDSYQQDYKAWWAQTGEPVASHDWAIARALERGETSVAEEIEIETAAGERRSILNYALPITNTEGTITGAVALNVDISDIKKAKEEAERANMAKSEFLAHMSHEIRTPISGVLGMVEVLHARIRDPEMRDHVALIRDAANALFSVVGDILDLSQIESGSAEVHPEVWRLRDTLPGIVAPLELLAETKGLAFSTEIESGVPVRVLLDGGKTAQVLRNLVSNAVKYTEAGSVSLEVSYQSEGETSGRLVFRVRDTGRGIPPEKQQEIFESFVRIRRSVREPGPPGTGLGLTITRRLVELLGGRIDLKSAPGEGSEFTVTLPVELPASEPSPEVPPSTAETTEPLPPLELLLTEDNAINRMFLTMALEEEGHSVTVAKNGKEAVAAAAARKERPFDAVLMDVQMPEMDGIEATRAIRDIDGPVARSPVVALTAFALREDKARFREAGMEGYVTKPVHFPDLWAELRRVTGGAGAP